MAVFAAIAFATFLFEDDDFVAFDEGSCNFANNFSSFDGRSADFNGTVGVREKHAVKLDRVAFLNILAEIVNIQELTGFGLELLSLNFYDNVHFIKNLLRS